MKLKYARELLAKGAQNVIISMAGDECPCLSHLMELASLNQSGTVKNSVGAGDSMVAGFTGEFVKSKRRSKSLQMGVAWNSNFTFSDDSNSRIY